MSKDDKYSKMKLKELIEEHKRVVSVLGSKSKEDDKREYEIQKKELEGYINEMKKLKKSQGIDEAFSLLIKGSIDTAINGGDLFENIEKAGKKDLSKLVKKQIVDKTGQKRTVWVRAQEVAKKVRGKTAKVIGMHESDKEAGYNVLDKKQLTDGSNYLKRMLNNTVQAAKNEVHEWKSAGSGVKKLLSGKAKEISPHEKKAMIVVAAHVAITVAMVVAPMAVGGGAAHAAAGSAAAHAGGHSAATIAGHLVSHFAEHTLGLNLAHVLAFTKGEEDSLDSFIKGFVFEKGEDVDSEGKKDKKEKGKPSIKEVLNAMKEINNGDGTEDGGAGADEEELTDDESEHYLEKMILAMSNSMGKYAEGQKEDKKQPKKDDGNNNSKDLPKKD